MAKTVTVTMTNELYRCTLWLLKQRYGKRKKAPRLFQLAAIEAAALEAAKLLHEKDYHVNDDGYFERGGEQLLPILRYGKKPKL